MNSENIKKTWNEVGNRIKQPTSEELNSVKMKKMETAQELLAKKYKRFSVFGLVMIFVSVSWLNNIFIISEDMRYVITILFAVYFATCSTIDFWLYRGVNSIDCFTMSVSEVVSQALYYKKKHLQSMCFLIPFAIIVLGAVVYGCNGNKTFLIGIGFGLIVGCVIGIRHYFDFMDQYKVLSDR